MASKPRVSGEAHSTNNWELESDTVLPTALRIYFAPQCHLMPNDKTDGGILLFLQELHRDPQAQC